MPDFDVVVLGGGTSGTLIAMEVSRGGRSAALVEAGLVGGESPYLADMPSKSLLQSARRGETWEHAVARRDEVAGHLNDTAATARLAEAGVTLLRGTGRVTKPGTVVVVPNPVKASLDGAAPSGPVTLRYKDLVLATGSEPVAPPVEGLTDVPTWTSAEALTCPDLPRRLIVLGAGPVGCELAQIYAAFGSQVTLVEAEPLVLPGEAAFTGEILGDALRRTGVDLRLGSPVVKAETLDSGLALTLADGTRIEADRVLLATGRRPRVQRDRARSAGHPGRRGAAAGRDLPGRPGRGAQRHAARRGPAGQETGRAAVGGGRRDRGRRVHAHGPVPGQDRGRQHPGREPVRGLPRGAPDGVHLAVGGHRGHVTGAGRGQRGGPGHGELRPGRDGPGHGGG